ncbi:hypothetical protein ACT6NV_06740 [Robiginitalea sp. IMCC44478]|uniref:hypothetical protein n=1 Tax=Robiginitalea sp. IMCC44478 TaxID=3459122 RepID=UPI0040422841
MKKLVTVLFVLSSLVYSCSNSIDPLQVETWRLASTFAYMTGTEASAEELGIDEQIYFEEGGRFIKSRERDNETNSVEGVWQEMSRNGQNGLLVNYPENSPLVFNCFGSPEEFYFVREGILIQDGATPCDGPEYRYLAVD